MVDFSAVIVQIASVCKWRDFLYKVGSGALTVHMLETPSNYPWKTAQLIKVAFEV